jgi:hypothetical protein
LQGFNQRVGRGARKRGDLMGGRRKWRGPTPRPPPQDRCLMTALALESRRCGRREEGGAEAGGRRGGGQVAAGAFPFCMTGCRACRGHRSTGLAWRTRKRERGAVVLVLQSALRRCPLDAHATWDIGICDGFVGHNQRTFERAGPDGLDGRWPLGEWIAAWPTERTT